MKIERKTYIIDELNGDIFDILSSFYEHYDSTDIGNSSRLYSFHQKFSTRSQNQFLYILRSNFPTLKIFNDGKNAIINGLEVFNGNRYNYDISVDNKFALIEYNKKMIINKGIEI